MPEFMHAPVLIVAVLLLAAFITPLLGKRQAATNAVFLGAGVVALVLSVGMTLRVLAQGTLSYPVGGWPAPYGIVVLVDVFAAYSSLVLATVALIIFWFAAFGPREVRHNGAYFTLILLLTAAMQGMVMAGDLFNLFVFIEISSLAAIAIIAIKGTKESVEASFRYLVLSALGSGGLLFSIALIFMITGHLNMDYIRTTLMVTAEQYPLNLLTSIGLMVVGFGVKAALFPMHVWLPDAHSNAPTASSALLSGLVVKVYIIALMRIAYLALGLEIFALFPIRHLFLALSTGALVAGSVFAMVQDNVKRLLAFSTVAQVGCIFLGFGLFNQRAIEGGVLHILNHAVMKSLLFLTAGVIIHQSGIKKLSQFSGLGRKMPLTFAAFTIGAMSMVGVPGTAGFISKLYLALGALDADMLVFAVLILISSLLNAAYYFPIIISAFFGRDSDAEATDPAFAVLAPVAVLAGMVFFFGMFPSLMVPLVRQTALLFVR
ncbi:MAG: Na(+)/H(+) antiporter subunit D [Firmicutes bacterium]|nr:Na(+)/H(+) antiporter subunit D [Bacillota bacterium]